ncbi:carbamate kinase [Nanchangia anserum]|uniref:Carbamate kinase n=1 Tax=Nanchangia anserum TaxID=2692125 RepID=A0A8I0KP19_9ACTO|nr:carbamate kinase [Nanchangia anserum]MBD3689901.1 carbamate kinase [Nanchangia anserum]QOX82282.1 carbamate kinase [Nanchangia anserum]
MRIVIALGGNALLRRGEPMEAATQRANVKVAAEQIAKVARDDDVELAIVHGNGPQVGLLALQAAAYPDVTPYPLDVLGAQTQALIGYMIEQELGNIVAPERAIVTLVTMVQVDADDPAFDHPTKPIGPVYSEAEARRLAAEGGWAIAPDGDKYRRVVASPDPQRIIELRSIRRLIEDGAIVTCGGGGGIPTTYDEATGTLTGIEAVIDKDLCASLLARELDADMLVIATDVAGVFRDWGTPDAHCIEEETISRLRSMTLAAGSMGPKVEAACRFVEATGKPAVIGSLEDIEAIVAGTAGTRVVAD